MLTIFLSRIDYPSLRLWICILIQNYEYGYGVRHRAGERAHE
jgi:hypothetical protein